MATQGVGIRTGQQNPVLKAAPAGDARAAQPGQQTPGTATPGSAMDPPSYSPPQVRPPVDQSTGQLGPEAIGLGNLGALIERQLAQPGAYGLDEVQRTKEYLAGEREAQRKTGVAGINADAARRGVFHSTMPVTSIGDLDAELMRASALEDVALQEKVAMSQQQGLQAAMQNAFGFLDRSQQGQQGLGQLGALAAQLGFQGAPDMNQATTNFLGLPGGQGGSVDPGVMAQLGQLLGGQQPGAGTPAPSAGPGPQVPAWGLPNMPSVAPPPVAQPQPARPAIDPSSVLPPELLAQMRGQREQPGAAF